MLIGNPKYIYLNTSPFFIRGTLKRLFSDTTLNRIKLNRPFLDITLIIFLTSFTKLNLT